MQQGFASRRVGRSDVQSSSIGAGACFVLPLEIRNAPGLEFKDYPERSSYHRVLDVGTMFRGIEGLENRCSDL